MKLDGKIAVITGGGDGIGRCACLRFAEEGADVIILEIRKEAGEETVRMIEEKGGKAVFIQTDIADPESVRSAFEKIEEDVTAKYRLCGGYQQ